MHHKLHDARPCRDSKPHNYEKMPSLELLRNTYHTGEMPLSHMCRGAHYSESESIAGHDQLDIEARVDRLHLIADHRHCLRCLAAIWSSHDEPSLVHERPCDQHHYSDSAPLCAAEWRHVWKPMQDRLCQEQVIFPCWDLPRLQLSHQARPVKTVPKAAA